MADERHAQHQGAQPDIAAAVSEVLVRYATGIDRRDWELFRTCFTTECDIDYGTMPTGETLKWDKADDVTAWMRASHQDMGHTMHRITNQRVEGEGSSVTATSYVDVLLMTPDGGLIINVAGFYNDHLIHTEHGWQITRRRFTWVRMQPGP